MFGRIEKSLGVRSALPGLMAAPAACSLLRLCELAAEDADIVGGFETNSCPRSTQPLNGHVNHARDAKAITFGTHDAVWLLVKEMSRAGFTIQSNGQVRCADAKGHTTIPNGCDSDHYFLSNTHALGGVSSQY